MPVSVSDILFYVLASASVIGIYGSLAALSADLAPILGKEGRRDRVLFAAKVVGFLILSRLLIGAVSPIIFRFLGAEPALWTFLMLEGLLMLAIISLGISLLIKSAKGERRVQIGGLIRSAAAIAAALVVLS
ncbi:MAG: hypothetical protein QI223_00280, partial [Candidatus Korarchaeota archaeon]|nr:hypothetical protein [Candidatus Korarchaeota archaeon]